MESHEDAGYALSLLSSNYGEKGYLIVLLLESLHINYRRGENYNVIAHL